MRLATFSFSIAAAPSEQSEDEKMTARTNVRTPGRVCTGSLDNTESPSRPAGRIICTEAV